MLCAVYGCYNSNLKPDISKEIRYHTFPKDSTLLQKWMHFCRKTKLDFNPKTGRVCSVHFCQSDYKRNEFLQMYGLSTAKQLMPDAAPSIYMVILLVIKSVSGGGGGGGINAN